MAVEPLGPWGRLERPTVVCLTAALAGLCVLFPLTNTDIWWHLAAGRQMMDTGVVLSRDTFSISAAGRPWIDLHWLFQLGVAAVHSFGGVAALVWVKVAVVGGAAAPLLHLALRPWYPLWVVPSAGMMLCLYAVRHLVLMRPIILTLLYMSLLFVLLERNSPDLTHGREGRASEAPKPSRPKLALASVFVIMILWVNSQGLYPIGVAMVASYFGGVVVQTLRRRPPRSACFWAAALGLSAAAPVVSPFGLDSFLLPLRLLGRIDPRYANIYAANISENLPPWQSLRQDPGALWHLPVVVLVIAASFWLTRRQLHPGRLLLSMVLLGLAMMAERNLLLLYWLGAPVAALNLSAAKPSLSRRWPPMVRIAGWLTLSACAALFALRAAGESPLASPAPFRLPEQSADRLARHQQTARVFCSVRYGGFLVWRLWPQMKPYIDGRLILRSRAEFADYLAVLDQPSRFDLLDARHRFHFAVLPVAYPDRYLGLIQHLHQHPQWQLVVTDGTETLFAHRRSGLVAADAIDLGRRAALGSIVDALTQRFGRAPKLQAAATDNLATLALALGHRDTSVIETIVAGRSDAGASLMRARAAYLRGDFKAAQSLAQGTLHANQDDINALNLLALVAWRRGDDEAALELIRRVMLLAPYDEQANGTLEEIERGLQ